MIYHIIAIIVAVLIDRLVGDPPTWPHPVKWFGKLIHFFDKKWNDGAHRKLKGSLMLIILMLIVLSVSALIVVLSYVVHPFLGVGVESLLIATTIAQKGLIEAALEVEKPLRKNDLALARAKLSCIVGRDTDQLSEGEIVRGTVETVAENTSDGITAPLFWALIGGAPLALTYRLINTCDSMVGYKNTVYKDFGWASARLDDIVNWLPARLTGLVMMLTTKKRFSKKAWSILFRDAGNHPSPNSGWGEAAVAALLGIRLGGVNYYQGQTSYRTEMGDPINPLHLTHICESVNIMKRTVSLFLFILVLGGMIFEFTITWL